MGLGAVVDIYKSFSPKYAPYRRPWCSQMYQPSGTFVGPKRDVGSDVVLQGGFVYKKLA